MVQLSSVLRWCLESSTDFQMSILRLLIGLYERIPTFMTSYVEKIMHIVLQTYSAGDPTADIFDICDVLIKTITQTVSTEVCVESLSTCWGSVEHRRKVFTAMTFLTFRCWRCSLWPRVGSLIKDLVRISPARQKFYLIFSSSYSIFEMIQRWNQRYFISRAI